MKTLRSTLNTKEFSAAMKSALYEAACELLGNPECETATCGECEAGHIDKVVQVLVEGDIITKSFALRLALDKE